MLQPHSSDPHGNQPLQRAGADLDEAAAAVILIHGRGASAANILGLADAIERQEVAFLAPDAAASTWYPHSFLAPLEQNEPWLSSALRRVEALVAEVTQAGIPPEKIVVAGFSQGACLASEYVARHAQRFGGLVAFSGGLIGSADGDGRSPHDKAFEYDGSLDGTPVFLGCSDVDAHIPVERVHESARVLEALGASVIKKIYPGMAHTIIDDEIRHFQKLVDAL